MSNTLDLPLTIPILWRLNPNQSKVFIIDTFNNPIGVATILEKVAFINHIDSYGGRFDTHLLSTNLFQISLQIVDIHSMFLNKFMCPRLEIYNTDYARSTVSIKLMIGA